MASQICLDVDEYNVVNMSNFDLQCGTGASMTLMSNLSSVASYNGTIKYMLYVVSPYVLLAYDSFQIGMVPAFGLLGVLLTCVIFMVAVGMGIWNPAVAIMMGVIGIGSAVGGTGEGSGTGTGAGWFSGGAGGGAFFGMGPGRGGGGSLARHIVYVVDRSGSMLTTFDSVKNEMLTSIGQLDGAKQDFHVILFAEGKPQEADAKRLVPATPEYKARATEFLRQAYAKGDTNVLPALNRAFDVLEQAQTAGKVIFLLTDSAFPDNQKVIDLCKARNTKKDVHVFTFLYGDRAKEAEETMKKVAQENGGKFKYVSAEE
jgi:hypothetical protein